MVSYLNVGLIVEDLLVNTYGFEPIREVEKGNYWIRRMDSQHSVVVVGGWHDGRGSRERGGVNLNVHFGETSIRVFSEDGFAQVRTGWEVLN